VAVPIAIAGRLHLVWQRKIVGFGRIGEAAGAGEGAIKAVAVKFRPPPLPVQGAKASPVRLPLTRMHRANITLP